MGDWFKSLRIMESKQSWMIPALIAALIHLSSLFGSFVYDDIPLIVEHPQLSAEGFSYTIWTRDYGMEFAGNPRGFYRPMFMTLVLLIHTFVGPNAFVFHLSALFILIIATILVTRIVFEGSKGSHSLAMITGIFYALHPARVEVASIIMSLPDLIVEVCALIIVLHLLRASSVTISERWRTGVICFGFAGIAALTKESAFFILPALAITATVIILRERQKLSTLFPVAGIVFGMTVGLLLRFLASIHTQFSITDILSQLLRGETAVPALKMLWHATMEIIIPGPVVFWQQFVGRESISASIALMFMVALIGFFWLLSLKGNRLFISLLVAWVGANIINLILLTAGGYPYSQRYLAVAPALMLLCTGGRHILYPLVLRWTKNVQLDRVLRPGAFLLAAYLAAHGAYALAGTFTCWTPLGFFIAMHEANPKAVIPLGAMAQTLNKNGASSLTIETCIQKATSLDRTDPQVPLLHNMMIKRYLADREFTEALRFTDWSLSFFPADSDKHALRSVALASLGRYFEALAAIDKAITVHPKNEPYLALRKQISNNMTSAQHNTPSPTGTR